MSSLIDEVEISDYGYVLENGTTAVRGPSQRLRNDPAVKAAYLGGALGRSSCKHRANLSLCGEHLA